MDTSVRVRLLLALASIPIAVVANSLRIVGTGLVVQYWSPDKGEGFFHTFSGWLIFVVSLTLLFGLHKILRAVWPADISDEALHGRKNSSADTVRRGLVLNGAGSGNASFVVVVLLLASAALLLHARSRTEVIAPRVQLSDFPRTLDSWSGTDVSIDKETLDILGPGDFLLREYENADKAQPPIDLFIAYFPSQRAGDTIHSPKHCLPGAGWRPIEASQISLSLAGRSFPVNRYVIARGEDRQLVLYWYQAHDRAVASEYWAKFYLIADSIRMNRSDGSLIRFSTPLARGEHARDAEARLLPLAARIVPLLDAYVPR
jgi:exosortase D (VPLPA-CTERM-specific)